MLSKRKKRIAALLMAVVVSVTTAFSLPTLAEEQPDIVETTEAEPASATDAVAGQETEVTEIDTEENTNVTQESLVVFDHIFNEGISLSQDFSSCELLVTTSDPSVFTKNTKVVSEYEGVYLLRFANAEETKSAYSYYYGKVSSIEVNKVCFSISTVEQTPQEVPQENTQEAPQEETGATTEAVPDVADLSGLNQGNDALSEAQNLPDVSLSGAIALIDTGCSCADKCVSVLGGEAGDDNGHGTLMFNAIKEEYPSARVLSIKALDASGRAQVSDIYAAIKFAIDSNVSVINLSMVAPRSSETAIVEQAINEAISKGIVVVGAAGNQGMDASSLVPSGMSGVVVAGACDDKGMRQSFSNYGATVDYNVVSSSTSEASAILAAMIARDGNNLKVNEGKLFDTDYTPDSDTEDADSSETDITTTETVTTEAATTETETATGGDATETDSSDSGKKKWNIKDLINGIFEMQTGSCAGYVSQRLGLSYMSRILYLYPYLLEHGWKVVGRGGAYDTSTQDGCNDLSSAVNRIAKPGDIIVFYSSPNWGNNDAQTHIGIINKTGGLGEREPDTNLYTYPTYDYDSTDNRGARTNYSIGRWTYYAKSDGKSSNSFEILSKVVVDEEKGELKLQKSSSMPEVTNGNSCYSLAGAVYNVFSGNTASGTPVATLTTDATGAATISNLNVGTYTIKEVKPPQGYALDTTEYHVTTNKSVVTRVDVTDRPLMDPVTILLKKQNTNGLPIAGAQYTVKYYKSVKMNTDPAAAGVPVDRTWTFKTDENGAINFSNDQKWFVSGDAFYLNAFNAAAMPEGTITIQETSAPAGYVLDSTIYTRQITPDANGDIGVSTFNAPTITEQTVRGDMAFTKKNEDGEALANVKFSLTCNDTGESHIIYTDANGYYSTASSYVLHSKDTNRDKAGSGIWFGNETLDDNRGALPYGTYTLKELRCDANKNKYKNIQPITFSITSNNQVYSLADVINYKFPLISTNVIDNETGTNVAALGDTFAGVDIVHLDKLEIGHKYKLTMKAHSKAKGEDLAVTEKKFEATATRMDVNVDVSFDVTDDLRGTDVVIFEYLVDEAYPDEILAFEENLDNSDQTIHFPSMGTTFLDDATGEHVAYPDEVVKHTDKIAYKNLIPGIKCKAKATLKYQDTGETVVDADGKELVQELEFTPESADGAVYVTFEFNASLLAGKSITAFEEIYVNDRLVMSECDLDNEDQTIHFPSMGTTFLDDATGEHVAYPDEVVKHTDKIAYKNLLPGIKCKAKATLKYQDTGETVVDADGKELVQELEFTPESADGAVYVTFEFNASLLAGKSITAFEEIYVNDRLVMSECDLDNEDQTIHYPSMGTTFLDDATGEHVAYPDEVVKHTDKIAYKNLIPGIKCKAKATLKYQDTGETVIDADGKELVQELEFTPESADGAVYVTFEFNASLLAGKSITAFEEIYVNDRLVMSECDLDNEDQTIHYPEIHTTAKDAVSLTHDGRRRHDAVIIDTVDMKNLIPGEKYRIDGVVMDYDSKNPYLTDNGEQVLASVEFTAEEADSSIDVTFPEIDSIKLLGKSLVCYEKLYKVGKNGDELIAVHEDIEDKDQTVTYDHFVGYIDMHIDLHTGGQGHKVDKGPGTGDPVKLFLLLGAALVSGSVVGVMIYKKKKGDKRHED